MEDDGELDDDGYGRTSGHSGRRRLRWAGLGGRCAVDGGLLERGSCACICVGRRRMAGVAGGGDGWRRTAAKGSRWRQASFPVLLNSFKLQENRAYAHSQVSASDQKPPETGANLMKISFPATFSRPQTLPLLLAPFFQNSFGVQRLRSVHALRSRGDIAVLRARSMARSSENCGGDLRGDAEMGFLRPATEDYVAEAIEAVRAGKVIAVPTDTLYGFACDACSMEAVHRIYDIKGRKHTSPLAICVGDVQDIPRFATTDHLPHGLLDSLLPGPVTVVLKRGESSILEKSLNPGLDSIGVRVPDSNFIRLICRGSESALALTSANLSGQPSSVDVKDFEILWGHCAYIYNGGVIPSSRAGSTVVDLTKLGQYKILRPGSAEEETVATLERFGLVEDSNVS
ncbi:DHBP synthase RibB-like alpha/beta domain [Striga hermonthica]|uniref:Threonylcarbamoyl-AMP synthase n=1 Tax=Striga hermonthica TaxID=68872 RepID=A0A9N7N5K6_STRHE|nr:DHBP synthase RibB-like alpha/beta domain [Striga hermonthica]